MSSHMPNIASERGSHMPNIASQSQHFRAQLPCTQHAAHTTHHTAHVQLAEIPRFSCHSHAWCALHTALYMHGLILSFPCLVCRHCALHTALYAWPNGPASWCRALMS